MSRTTRHDPPLPPPTRHSLCDQVVADVADTLDVTPAKASMLLRCTGSDPPPQTIPSGPYGKPPLHAPGGTRRSSCHRILKTRPSSRPNTVYRSAPPSSLHTTHQLPARQLRRTSFVPQFLGVGPPDAEGEVECQICSDDCLAAGHRPPSPASHTRAHRQYTTPPTPPRTANGQPHRHQ